MAYTAQLVQHRHWREEQTAVKLSHKVRGNSGTSLPKKAQYHTPYDLWSTTCTAQAIEHNVCSTTSRAQLLQHKHKREEQTVVKLPQMSDLPNAQRGSILHGTHDKAC